MSMKILSDPGHFHSRLKARLNLLNIKYDILTHLDALSDVTHFLVLIDYKLNLHTEFTHL